MILHRSQAKKFNKERSAYAWDVYTPTVRTNVGYIFLSDNASEEQECDICRRMKKSCTKDIEFVIFGGGGGGGVI